MMPLVVDYLRTGKTLADLEAEHGVVAREHNGKVSLCYHQINAREDDPLACQCRGLILQGGTWDVIAYPFDRFFNLGQGAAADIDWLTARVQEKLDGTLFIVYHDEGQWHCATRKDPECRTVSQAGITFRQMADLAAQDMGRGSFAQFMSHAPHGYTYMFELTAPENQIVCRYPDRRLTLLGMRNMHTYAEERPLFMDAISPATFDADDFDAVRAMVEERDPAHHEGVVVVDAAFNRVKVKSSAYVFAHGAAGKFGASWRNVFEAVAANSADDVYPLVPQLVQDRIDIARESMSRLFVETQAVYHVIQPIDDMKEFASLAKRHRWPSALFAMKRNGVTLGDFAAQTNPKTLVELCGLDDAA